MDDDIEQWLQPEHSEKLKGKSIAVGLRIEEIELIRWMLDNFKVAKIVLALNDAAQRIAEEEAVNYKTRQETQRRIEEGFSNAGRYERMLELIRTRLNDAVETALENEQAQPKLDLGTN